MFHLIAVAEFADESSFTAGMASSEGQAVLEDVPTFATAGAVVLTGPGTEAPPTGSRVGP